MSVPAVVHEAVQRVVEIDGQLRGEVEQVWFDVSEAGGAVGFVPPVDRAQVAAVLDAALAEVRSGRRVLGVLRVDGRVAGFGFLARGNLVLRQHWATVFALQVHPRHQGAGLGRLLLEGLHQLAREDGLEFLHLTYRDGTGVGSFYERMGYREVGRIPGAIRVAPGDDRDDVHMVRHLS